MSYYCEDEDIEDRGKIALKILRGIGNEGLKRLNASGMSDADKKRPDKIWELFESQLKTNLNFRVHRLHLMDYRQRSEGSVDDFVTRAHTQALKCEFEESELEERIIELMIASTPIEEFQRELLGKAKGYKLTVVGLPTCEKIGLVTIHCDDLRPKPDVTTVEGLKQAYPGQFDTLGDFRGVAKFHLKQD